MSSHLSDIGFSKDEEELVAELDTMYEMYMYKTARVFTVDNRSYMVFFIDKDIEFWLPVSEEDDVDTYNFELHYNTHRWDNVKNPSWESKTQDNMQGLLSVWEEDELFIINATVPNAMYAPEFFENDLYKCQMACFVESIMVFDDVESFHKEIEMFSEMSFVPTGQFPPEGADEENFEQNSQAWINGIVENVECKTNSYTKRRYYHILVKCLKMKFDLLLDADEIKKTIIPGNIVSANVWISGKIIKSCEEY